MVAHPDDESFGLGAIISSLVDAGARVDVLCFTHGEASTLGAAVDLGDMRARELEEAARHLGVHRVRLLSFPDGHLSEVEPSVLDALVEEHGRDVDVMVSFEPSGVTGHPDHQAATAAAHRVAARRGLAVVEWGVGEDVAVALRRQTGTPFVALIAGTEEQEVVDVEIDRSRQLDAIACHDTQTAGNVVLVRRLELQGSIERIRLVRNH